MRSHFSRCRTPASRVMRVKELEKLQLLIYTQPSGGNGFTFKATAFSRASLKLFQVDAASRNSAILLFLNIR